MGLFGCNSKDLLPSYQPEKDLFYFLRVFGYKFFLAFIKVKALSRSFVEAQISSLWNFNFLGICSLNSLDNYVLKKFQPSKFLSLVPHNIRVFVPSSVRQSLFHFLYSSSLPYSFFFIYFFLLMFHSYDFISFCCSIDFGVALLMGYGEIAKYLFDFIMYYFAG